MESSFKQTGKVTENIGHYDPVLGKVEVNKERYDYWLSQGAQPSDAVLKIILPKEELKKLFPDKPKKKVLRQAQDGQAQEGEAKGKKEEASKQPEKPAEKEKEAGDKEKEEPKEAKQEDLQQAQAKKEEAVPEKAKEGDVKPKAKKEAEEKK